MRERERERERETKRERDRERHEANDKEIESSEDPNHTRSNIGDPRPAHKKKSNFHMSSMFLESLATYLFSYLHTFIYFHIYMFNTNRS